MKFIILFFCLFQIRFPADNLIFNYFCHEEIKQICDEIEITDKFWGSYGYLYNNIHDGIFLPSIKDLNIFGENISQLQQYAFHKYKHYENIKEYIEKNGNYDDPQIINRYLLIKEQKILYDKIDDALRTGTEKLHRRRCLQYIYNKIGMSKFWSGDF